MKRFLFGLILAIISMCVSVFGQELTKRRIGVFAQPIEDAQGRKLLKKWYDGGARVFIGWASSKQTSGVDSAKDRVEQLLWRSAVKALGPDATYVDYVLPDWKLAPTTADIQLMIDDPQCLGFFGPEEPNLSPPTDTTGKVWRVSLAQWQTYWDTINAVDPINSKGKLRVGDFGGPKLSAAWGSYTGADAIPYSNALTTTCTNWHPFNVYGDQRTGIEVYPARSVRMLGRIASNKERWYISECAFEEVNRNGRAPTYAEVLAQYTNVLAEDMPNAPIVLWGWFPQKPKPNASHVFDNTTEQQFETVKAINRKFLGLPEPSTQPVPSTLPTTLPPEPIDLVLNRLNALEGQLTAMSQQLDDLKKEIKKPRVLIPQE